MGWAWAGALPADWEGCAAYRSTGPQRRRQPWPTAWRRYAVRLHYASLRRIGRRALGQSPRLLPQRAGCPAGPPPRCETRLCRYKGRHSPPAGCRWSFPFDRRRSCPPAPPVASHCWCLPRVLRLPTSPLRIRWPRPRRIRPGYAARRKCDSSCSPQPGWFGTAARRFPLPPRSERKASHPHQPAAGWYRRPLL